MPRYAVSFTFIDDPITITVEKAASAKDALKQAIQTEEALVEEGNFEHVYDALEEAFNSNDEAACIYTFVKRMADLDYDVAITEIPE